MVTWKSKMPNDHNAKLGISKPMQDVRVALTYWKDFLKKTGERTDIGLVSFMYMDCKNIF